MTTEALLELLDGVKRTARGWSSRCPAHNDKSPSLSIREGDDHKILLRCFAGCTIENICSALHLQKRDLFPRQSSEQIRTAQRARQRREQAKVQASRFLGARTDLFREAERVIAAGSTIPPEYLSEEQSDRFMDALGDAHHAMRLEMGEYDYAEWSSRLGAHHRTITVGESRR